MNERIQQLADNATHYANGVCDANANADWYETRDKKFAELLILECAEITDGLSKLFPRTDIGFDVGYTMGTTRATKEIKKHFGVEEWTH